MRGKAHQEERTHAYSLCRPDDRFEIPSNWLAVTILGEVRTPTTNTPLTTTMDVRSVRCPQCGSNINAPAHLARVRCGGCQHVFSPADAEKQASQSIRREAKPATQTKPIPIALIAGVLAGLLILGTTLAGLAWIGTRSSEADASGSTTLAAADSSNPSPSQATLAGGSEPVFPEASEQEIARLKIARLPESKRKQVYKMIRDTAVTSIEKPILAPDGSPPRIAMEKMLEATYQNSLRQIQALHDITPEQIQQIIAEGDMKVWDKRPRSNARRNGKRLYPEEQSRGWKGKIGI